MSEFTKRQMTKYKRFYTYNKKGVTIGSIFSFLMFLMAYSSVVQIDMSDAFGNILNESSEINCAGTRGNYTLNGIEYINQSDCIVYFNITTFDYSIKAPKQLAYFDYPNTTYELQRADKRYRSDNPKRWKPHDMSGKWLPNGTTTEYRMFIYKPMNKTIKFGVKSGMDDFDPILTGVITDDFFTKIVDHKVDLTTGYATFIFSNPLNKDITINESTLESVFNVVRGEVLSSKYSYEIIIPEKIIKVDKDICDYEIFLKEINFTDNSTNITITEFWQVNETVCHKIEIDELQPIKTKLKDLGTIIIPKYGELTIRIDLEYTPNTIVDWIPFSIIDGVKFKQDKWLWFNESWDFKKEIQIDGIGDDIPANYQLKLEVDYDSDMNSTFKDLRFTNSDENVSSDYWVEQNVSSTNATVWVEVPTISNTTNTTVYMYYGNPTATSESNGTNVFEDYQDKDSTSDWSTTGTISITTSGDYLRFYSATKNTGNWAEKTISVTPTHYILETRFKTISLGADDNFAISLKDYPTLMTHTLQPRQATSNWYYYTSATSYQSVGAITEGTEYIRKTIIDETDSSTGIDFFLMDTSRSVLSFALNRAFASGGTDMDTLYFGDGSVAGYADGYVRWNIIRKYTATEPTYSFGAEESQNTAPIVLAYYQFNETNQTFNLTYDSDTSVTINWNVTDDFGINVSNCTIYYRNYNNATDEPLLNYIAGVREPSMDSDGYRNVSCSNITINSTSERLYHNFTDNREWLQYTAAIDITTMTNDGTYAVFGNKAIKGKYLNHTTGANKTIRYLISMSNTSTTVGDFLVHLCNSSYVSGDYKTSPNCVAAGAYSPITSVKNSFGYYFGTTTTSPTGYIGPVLVTDTMYSIGSCELCTNSGNAWIIDYTSVNEDQSQTSSNLGGLWSHVAWETNTMAHYFNNARFEANLSVYDIGGLNLNDYRFDYYGEIPNQAPALFLQTDNITGGLVSFYDIHGVTELGNIWINVSVADNEGENINCSFYLLNNDTTYNSTLLNNYELGSDFGICPYEWNTTTISDGDYRLILSATDGTDTTNRTSAGYIRLDNFGNVLVTLNAPENDTSTIDSTPNFNFTVSGSYDSYSCELFLNDTGYGVTNYVFNQSNKDSIHGLWSASSRTSHKINLTNKYINYIELDMKRVGTLTGAINFTVRNASTDSLIYSEFLVNAENVPLTDTTYNLTISTPTLLNGEVYIGVEYLGSGGNIINYVGVYVGDDIITGLVGFGDTSFTDYPEYDMMLYFSTTTFNNTATIITANTSLSDSIYNWTVSCISGGITNNSETRLLTITNTISDCIIIPSPNKEYKLINNILTTIDDCISITDLSNVTIDCQGYSITGDTLVGYGYTSYKGSNNVVNNCTFIDLDTIAASFHTGENNSIENSIFYNINLAPAYDYPIGFTNINNSNITKNIINNTGTGLLFVGSGKNNSIYNNTIENITYEMIYISGDFDYNLFYDNRFKNITDSLSPIFYFDQGILEKYIENNTIYNNLFNSSVYIVNVWNGVDETAYNFWNTTEQPGTRIYTPGPNIGGNYYAYPNGSGYSDICVANNDLFCAEYIVYTNNTDYLPLGFRIITITVYLEEISADNDYELGSIAQLKANITYNNGSLANLSVCLDIDASGYGDNFICNTSTVWYNFTTIASLFKFNNGTTSINFTSNDIVNITLSGESELDYAYINLTGYNTSDIFPEDINITLGNQSIVLNGYINETTAYISDLNGSTQINHSSAAVTLLSLDVGTSINLNYISLNITGDKYNFSERNVISTEDPLDWDKVQTYRINDTHLYTLLSRINSSDVSSCVGGGGTWFFYYTESFNDGLSWTTPTYIDASYCTLGWDFWGSYMGNGSEIFITFTSGNTGSTHPLAYQSIHMLNSLNDRTSWTSIRQILNGFPATYYYSSNGAETSDGDHHLTYSGGACNKGCYSDSPDAITYTSRNTTLFIGLTGDSFPDISVSKDNTLLINHLRNGYYYESNDGGSTWGTRKLVIWNDSCDADCRGLSLFYDSDIGEYIFIQSSIPGTVQYFDGGVYRSIDGINFTNFTTLHFINGVGSSTRNHARDCTYNRTDNWLICPNLAEDNPSNADAGTRTMYEYDFPRYVNIDISDNGIIDYNATYLGFNDNITIDNITEINDFLSEDTYLNFALFTGTSATIDLLLDAQYPTSKIDLNITNLESFLNGTFGDNNITFNVTAADYGTLQLDALNISYSGYENVSIKGHYINGDNATMFNDTHYANLYYSTFNIDLPNILQYIEFIPGTPWSDNVTPYGQSSTVPILNVTALVQGGKTMDWYMLNNETHSCVNLTASSNSTKSDGYYLNTSWIKYATNISYNDYFSIYMWADYNCSYSSWMLWEPKWYFRGCCTGCICSEDLS